MEDLLEWGVACPEVAAEPPKRLNPRGKALRTAPPQSPDPPQPVIRTVSGPPQPSISVNFDPIVMIGAWHIGDEQREEANQNRHAIPLPDALTNSKRGDAETL